jgi:hypothetical protein
MSKQVIESILKVLWFTPGRRGRWGLPACWWAGPGVGKTTQIEHAARAFGLGHCETLSPGERGEGAFGVVPMPSADGSRLLYPAPDWTAHFAHDKGGVVFVDEINRAAPAIQPPLLGLINELRIGGQYLGSRTRVAAAANPTETAPGVYEMDPAEANRMGHLEWPAPAAEDWGGWALGGCNGEHVECEFDALAEEERVLKAWPDAFGNVVGRVTAFLRAYPSLLWKQPAEGDPNRGRAWPSPRSWELGLRALAGCLVHKVDAETTDLILAAFIGQAAAAQYSDWLAKQDLPDPIKVLDGQVKFKPDPDRLDRTVAVLSSCAAIVAPAKSSKREARTKRLWEIIYVVLDATPDIVEAPVKVLVEAGLSEDNNPDACAALKKMYPYLIAARNG